MQPDGRFAEESDELGVGNVDGELDIVLRRREDELLPIKKREN